MEQTKASKALGYLQIFVGVGAVAGGLAFVSDPSGASLGIDSDVLNESPFPDFLVPGLVLLVVLGLGHLAAAVLSLIPRRHARLLGIFAGIVLMVWIASQVWWIGYLSWLQPFYLGLGLLEVILAKSIR